jgi:hypothetical protein
MADKQTLVGKDVCTLACPEWVSLAKIPQNRDSHQHCEVHRVLEDFIQIRVRINVQLPKGFFKKKVPPGHCMRAWHFH